MIEIRKASPEDYPLIQKMAHQTWPSTFSSILSQEQITYMLEMMYSLSSLEQQVSKKGHVFLVASEEDTSLGYTSYELNYNNTGKTKVHKIYVLPQAQGKGVGKLLMNSIAAIAATQNNHTLSLNVNRDNAAVDFYERIGFRKTGEENIPIGNGYYMEDFIMEKPL